VWGVQQDERTALRSRSFGAIADGYDHFRPGPPPAALDWLIPEGASDVIEVGAGTGAVTRALLERGLRVRAVEPDPRMREILAERAPAADVVEGAGEAIPSPDGAADVVLYASAWHWVDEARAVPEVARVLRPGGRFALLWNGANRGVPWVRSLWAGGVPSDDEEAKQVEQGVSHRRQVDLGPSAALFTEPERHLVSWERTVSRQELLGLIGTYSGVIVMDDEARHAFFANVERFLDTDPATAGRSSYDLPMGALCWRADRRGL
jgi:SAM-dependent methyltransferase